MQQLQTRSLARTFLSIIFPMLNRLWSSFHRFTARCCCSRLSLMCTFWFCAREKRDFRWHVFTSVGPVGLKNWQHKRIELVVVKMIWVIRKMYVTVILQYITSIFAQTFSLNSGVSSACFSFKFCSLISNSDRGWVGVSIILCFKIM